MTETEKLKYLDIALRILGVQLTSSIIAKVIKLYDKLLEVDGDMNLKDVIDINNPPSERLPWE